MDLSLVAAAAVALVLVGSMLWPRRGEAVERAKPLSEWEPSIAPSAPSVRRVRKPTLRRGYLWVVGGVLAAFWILDFVSSLRSDLDAARAIALDAMTRASSVQARVSDLESEVSDLEDELNQLKRDR